MRSTARGALRAGQSRRWVQDIAEVNIRRWSPPARSLLTMRSSSCVSARRSCRKRCRKAQAVWPRFLDWTLRALGTVEAVNFNAPTQTVIAGQRSPVETVCKLALSAGAQRAVPLPVSAPFHSSLLKPAADRLSAYLSHVEIRAPRIPVVNNIDVAIASTPQEIRDALARQVAGPVRWVECVRRLVLEGATQIIECGPGKVLTGLTKRIDRSLGHAAIHDP